LEDDPVIYEGELDEDSLRAFVNTHAHTQRTHGGSLSAHAGRHEMLDELAGKFVDANTDYDAPYANMVVGEARTIVALTTEPADMVTHYEYYLKAMDHGMKWIEHERLRLRRMLDKKEVGLDKLDNFEIRLNILNTFRHPDEEEHQQDTDGFPEYLETEHEEL